MKKLLSLSFASLALVAMAGSFSPSIGVKQFKDVQVNDFLLPVRFESLSGNGAISPRELVATNGLTVGETWLYIFKNNAYTAWKLESTGWTAAATSTDDLGPISADDTVKLAAGDAIWITGVNGKDVSIYGNVVASMTSTIVRGKTNLLINPTDTAVNGSALADKLAGAAVGDRILPIGDTFSGTYVKFSTGWKQNTGSGYKETPLPEIAANQGFWYVAKSGDGQTSIQW